MPPTQTAPVAPKAGEENPAVNDLLAFAQVLADEKTEVYGKIEANRQTLRNYKKMGLLSDEQVKAIDLFYPPIKTKAAAAAAAS